MKNMLRVADGHRFVANAILDAASDKPSWWWFTDEGAKVADILREAVEAEAECVGRHQQRIDHPDYWESYVERFGDAMRAAASP